VQLAKIQVGAGVPDRPQAVSAVFSNIEKRGAWQVPSTIKARSVFGSVILDFRDARFAAAVTELQVNAVFGDIAIVVPPNLAVDCEGSAVFGNFEHGDNAMVDPDRPVLRIVGKAVFANIEIRTLLPGESERDARRRRKRERRQLASPVRPSLPPHSE
jgi:hypothetical protein